MIHTLVWKSKSCGNFFETSSTFCFVFVFVCCLLAKIQVLTYLTILYCIAGLNWQILSNPFTLSQIQSKNRFQNQDRKLHNVSYFRTKFTVKKTSLVQLTDQIPECKASFCSSMPKRAESPSSLTFDFLDFALLYPFTYWTVDFGLGQITAVLI